MKFEAFESIVKYGLSNLYDFAALESHPQLIETFAPPAEFSGNKGAYLRELFLKQIETLKPKETTPDFNAPEWRVYIILQKRYIESQNTQDVANQLSLSERQLRRSLHKAIHALSLLLWDHIQQSHGPTKPDASDSPASPEFIINREELNLQDIINGVIKLHSSRMVEENVQIHIQENALNVQVENDRVILRQILIGLVNNLLQAHVKDLTFSTGFENDQPVLVISSNSYSGDQSLLELQDEEQENSIGYWSNRLNILIEEDYQTESSTVSIQLLFPTAQQKVILIVDDQEPALKMFTRYLSRTNFKIIGLRKPTKVLQKAKELQPALILLDIMMPKVDGWELFQSLKLDESTKHIPVIICSAWGEPELAKSLGATAFLRKPVTQRELLAAIQFLNIPN